MNLTTQDILNNPIIHQKKSKADESSVLESPEPKKRYCFNKISISATPPIIESVNSDTIINQTQEVTKISILKIFNYLF